MLAPISAVPTVVPPQVGFIIILLTREALVWASQLLQKSSPLLRQFGDFIRARVVIFIDPGMSIQLTAAFHMLQQGYPAVPKYPTKFRWMVVDTEWNYYFQLSLNNYIKDDLAWWTPHLPWMPSLTKIN